MANKFLRALLGGLAGGAQGVSQEYLRQQDLGEQRKREAVEALRFKQAQDRQGKMDDATLEGQRLSRAQLIRGNINDLDPNTDLTGNPEAIAAYEMTGGGLRRGKRTEAAILKGQNAPDTDTAENFLRGLMGGAKPTVAEGRATSTTLPYAGPEAREIDTVQRPLSAPERLREQTLAHLKSVIDAPDTDELTRKAYQDAYAAQGGARIPARPKPMTQVVPDESSASGFSAVSTLDGQEVSRTPAPAPAGYRKAPRRLTVSEAAAARSLGLDPEDDSKWTPEQSGAFINKVNPPKASGGSDDDRGVTDNEVVQLMGMAPEVRMAVLGSYTKGKMDKLLPKLIASGLDNFGRPISENATARFTELDSSVGGLQALKEAIQVGEKKFGPVQGYASRWNPYDEEGKSIIAKINLVRQRVGKALEGGVLRKEDEEKYKHILATINDMPSVSYSKIDDLIKTLERDRATFATYLRLSGRFVAPGVAGSGGNTPAAEPTKAPPDQSGTWRWDVSKGDWVKR